MVRRLLSNPVIVGSVIVLLLAARWIWVAGLGDYAWDYEVAERILRGEVFYRDFILLRGPLSYYTLAAFIVVLGHLLFVYHIHLWISYLLCLGAGLLLVRELGATRSSQIFGISLAAVAACPVFTWGHALDYLAPFLAGLAIFCVLRSGAGSPWWGLLSGAVAALAIYHKQNVGIAAAVCIPLFLRRKALILYLAGFLSVFAITFWVFASQAGATEVWRQLFTDAASTKGGFLFLVLRSIPRVIFRPDLPMRRAWEFLATAIVYAAALPVVTRTFSGHNARSVEEIDSFRLGFACIAGACLAIVASFARLDFALPERIPAPPWVSLLELVYIFFFVLCAAYFKGALIARERNWRAALFLVLAITAAQEASDPNFAYSAPLVIPLLVALLARAGAAPGPKTAAAAVAGLYLLGTTVVGPPAYYGMCAYRSTYALPAGSPFQGLRAPLPYARRTIELWDQARPALQNRRTLWLVGGGGPFLAFGGLPVIGGGYYMPDSVPQRLAPRLIQDWQNNPPDVVLLSDGFQYPHSALLTATYIREHVLEGYVEVWRSRVDPQIRMWVRRRPLEASSLPQP